MKGNTIIYEDWNINDRVLSSFDR